MSQQKTSIEVPIPALNILLNSASTRLDDAILDHRAADGPLPEWAKDLSDVIQNLKCRIESEQQRKGYSRHTVLECNLADLVDNPDNAPEWSWINQNGAFSTAKKQPVESGAVIVDVKTHVRKKDPHIPIRLNSVFMDALIGGYDLVLFHRGV